MHRQWGIGEMTTTARATQGWVLEGRERSRGVAIRMVLRYMLLLLLLSLLQLCHVWTAQDASGRKTACLQGTAIEARAVVIITLPNDFPTANDDTTMAVVQRRL